MTHYRLRLWYLGPDLDKNIIPRARLRVHSELPTLVCPCHPAYTIKHSHAQLISSMVLV